ncbi:Rpn family recombination-promoting nuclease/putative transposase [Leptolyngbya sp. AN03gr2]|uniref:Rpn family recombination-promoting nuclease/putative transposase n=1 Tax=unclassified Leptolyngbya TaxID=2650499 RepID=UPI003D322D23
MPFDNLCKLLAEKHPDRFAAWILGSTPTSVKILKSELSIEPIRADSVTFFRTAGRILHLEFQTTWISDPPMPLRLIDYWVRLYRLYRVPITQAVVVLLPPSENTTIETVFEVETTRHEFQVIKLWEQDPTDFLQDPVLLPFAVFAQAQSSEALLRQVAQQVSEITPNQQRQEVSTYVQLMAGLKYDKNQVRRIFREGMMRESVIYQEILQEGRQEGRQEGEQSAIERVATNMLLKQMTPETIAEITGLTLEQIEQLRSQLA